MPLLSLNLSISLSLSHFLIFSFFIFSFCQSLILSFSHTLMFPFSLSLSHSLILFPNFLSPFSLNVCLNLLKSVFSFHETIRMIISVLLYFLSGQTVAIFWKKVCQSIDTLFFNMGQAVKIGEGACRDLFIHSLYKFAMWQGISCFLFFMHAFFTKV